MPNREDINRGASTVLLATTTAGDATPVVSAALDCQGFDTASFQLAIGATLGTGSGAMTYAVSECDTVGGTYTAAAAADVVDTGGALAANTTKRIAYVGSKRFAKLTVTPKANDVFSITGYRSNAAGAPVANPL